MPELRDITANSTTFFQVLPQDWQEVIAPTWPDYANSSRILALMEGEEVLAGLILFSRVSPDTQSYYGVAQYWFDQEYLYIGFLFVPENRRGHGYGTLLLEKLFTSTPGRSYWLSIDDPALESFYVRLGFQLVKEVEGDFGPEWILVRP